MRKLTERGAVDLMRDGRRHLVQMHTVGGKKWFLVPGGEVKGEIAQALLARPDIQPSNDGLFPGISQTYKFRPIAT
jgi:hypothetical protein